MDLQALTPSQIVAELDKYIVGQQEAKRAVAIALRNRWRRLNAPPELREEIVPNNIIMIGPTGVGKTEIARRLAKLAGAPFVKVEATKFTEVGYVGRDVESMVRDLVEVAVNMVKAERQREVQAQALELADERLLDVLVPRPGTGFAFSGPSPEGLPASGWGELEDHARVRFRERLKAGELEDRLVEIEVTSEHGPVMQIFGPMGLEEMGLNLQEILGNLGRRRKKRRLPVSEARQLLAQEEAQKLIDMDAVIQEALERVQNAGIIFIDEIDKIASPAGAPRGAGPDVSREGVQRDLLPIVEGSNVMTKYGMVKTDHILFIASGAFHAVRPSDLIPELQGRFPIRVELKPLGEEDFYQILTLPQNALTKQYAALLAAEGVELEFTDEALREIARIAACVNEQVENIGARRLHTILTTVLEEVLFDVPDRIRDARVRIDVAHVQRTVGRVLENRDLSRYIL
ncbi:MAG: ATP-dependent protease ATPase subunit HslU [Bacteroidota bacterium]|nr:ATP-dependent protease ATPase subunit HslU [Bacteroidota bacterium]MDW8138273.1 ATP-dependent protease ATPase subunit HslU [Bacteroidota bacterium]